MAALVYSLISKPGSVHSFPRFPLLFEKIQLKDKNHLEAPLLNVLQALKGIEAAVTVPWAAEKAWEELIWPGKKRKSQL